MEWAKASFEIVIKSRISSGILKVKQIKRVNSLTIVILAYKFYLNQAIKLRKRERNRRPQQKTNGDLEDGPRCSAPWSILPWGGAVATAQDSPQGAVGNAPQGIPLIDAVMWTWDVHFRKGLIIVSARTKSPPLSLSL
ncbi:hypothetical protein OUZ56_019923 [Daphnia magna]|uniref:Uncharacterized protein n=1 Tax=Daphnia magna TaxID=35525 RepID=A0ABQ9ZD09_9CRUS|nr:hypothetical protein OUZ56_019923 [Daphnia magna]